MANSKRRLTSLRFVVFVMITLIVIQSCWAVPFSVNTRVSSVKIVHFPSLGEHLIVPKIKVGSLLQIILLSDNQRFDRLRVALTKSPGISGEICNPKLFVTPSLKPYVSKNTKESKSVYVYLSPYINKNLNNLTYVWVCLSNKNEIISNLSELSENISNLTWMHQGESSKIRVGSSGSHSFNRGNESSVPRSPRSLKLEESGPGSRRSSETPLNVALDSPNNPSSTKHPLKEDRTSSGSVPRKRTSTVDMNQVVPEIDFRTSGNSGVERNVEVFEFNPRITEENDTLEIVAKDDNASNPFLVLSSEASIAMDLPRSRGTRNIEDPKELTSDNAIPGGSGSDVDPTPTATESGGLRVTGIRVEKHSKGIIYEEGTILLQADYEAEIVLFGYGLTKGVAVQFTAHEDKYGGRCDTSTSNVFLLESAHGHWAKSTIRLPIMLPGQHFWYLCTRETAEAVAVHQGTPVWLTISTYSLFLPVWLQVIILLILLVLSGLFSGLNLGLMALDKTELKIVMNTGTPKERAYAKAIEPVRRHGNFLLCTLLLGNVLVNSTLTILLDTLSTGLIAVIGSTTGIVIFGEIVPQAICSRHGLAVGARTAWLVRIFMVLTGVASWPISKILDLMLGEEIGNTYDRERLKELIKVTQDRNDLRLEEQNIICGALEMSRKTVGEVMTKLDDIYMLSIERSLDFSTINEIMEQGYSRIPIYDGERTNIMSVLFIKDLAFIDPDDDTPLRTLTQFYQNVCNFVFEDTTLDIIFKEFKEGNKGHMAFVQRVNNEGDCDPFYEVIGLVTLEDVIEELIQAEIVDETDVFTDNKSKKRRKNVRRDFKEFSQQNQPNHRKVQISPQMQVAAFQFLRSSVEPFKEGNLSEGILKRMLNQDLIHIMKTDPAHTEQPNFIFVQGKPVDFFVLILEGHVEVTIGKENLTFESGPFTYFGLMALVLLPVGESPSPSTQLSRNSIVGSMQSLEASKSCFTPDYSVKAATEVTFLKVKRTHYVAARRAYLLQQSQKDPLAEETFEKEMEKMLRDESLTSPVWEREDNESIIKPHRTHLPWHIHFHKKV